MSDQECEAWADATGKLLLPPLYVQLFLEVFRNAKTLGRKRKEAPHE